jgi:hypothetical protein
MVGKIKTRGKIGERFWLYVDAASRSSSCKFLNSSMSSSFLFHRKSALFKSQVTTNKEKRNAVNNM